MVMDDAARSGLTAEQVRDVIAKLASPDVALDLMRGIDVFLNCVPGASLVALRNGFRSAGLTSPRGCSDPR